MDILFYLKQKNLIFLVLVSVISFYIIRTIDCCTDTFYPYIYSKLGIKENEMINYVYFSQLTGMYFNSM